MFKINLSLILVAEKLTNWGAHIIGFGRKPAFDSEDSKHISEYFTKANFSDFLKKCDYVINILPSTDETIGMLNGDVFQNCKGAFYYL